MFKIKSKKIKNTWAGVHCNMIAVDPTRYVECYLFNFHEIKEFTDSMGRFQNVRIYPHNKILIYVDGEMIDTAINNGEGEIEDYQLLDFLEQWAETYKFR